MELEKLNFPEKLEEYRNIDISKVWKRKKTKGIFYCKDKEDIKKWYSSFMFRGKIYSCGYHISEASAEYALKKKKKQIQNNENI
jgi:5-formaminoimidazole-4-carboxamide-1-beta-D-ribofuranosyl 5'-monophosphate synthetase